MSLGAEGDGADKPITGDKHLASGETSEPSSPLPVVISADGSATIDGVPVPVVGDESVDIAILDTLHGYARSRSSPVRAAISDPSAGYVAIVEVAPDGSSRLLQQHQEDTAEDAEDEEPAGSAGDEEPAGSAGSAGSGLTGSAGAGGLAGSAESSGFYAKNPDLPEADAEDPGYPGVDREAPGFPRLGLGSSPFSGADPEDPGYSDVGREAPGYSGADAEDPGYPGVGRETPGFSGIDDEDPGFSSLGPGSPGISGIDDEADMTAQPAQPQRASPPALSPDPDKPSRRGRKLLQSDDEYEAPPLHSRPWVVGLVGAIVAVAVFVPLVLLGNSSGGGKTQDSAADSAKGKDTNPSATSPAPTDSASISASPSPNGSPSASASKSASASAPASPKPKPPPTPPKPEGDPEMPKGEVLIRNEKYGYCLDLPGTGKAAPDFQAHDSVCAASGTDNQEWVLDRVSKGGGTRGADLYLIRNVKSEICLELPGRDSAQVTSPVGTSTCNSSNEEDNQLWWFDKRPNGTYWIRNQKSSDLCLDVSRTDKQAEHADTTIFGCNAVDDHEWRFRES